MHKTTYVLVTTRLIIKHDDNTTPEEVVENMDYSFTAKSDNCEITDTEVREVELKTTVNHS